MIYFQLFASLKRTGCITGEVLYPLSLFKSILKRYKQSGRPLSPNSLNVWIQVEDIERSWF